MFSRVEIFFLMIFTDLNANIFHCLSLRYTLQVPDESREPSTISRPRADGPVPTLSTATDGA